MSSRAWRGFVCGGDDCERARFGRPFYVRFQAPTAAPGIDITVGAHNDMVWDWHCNSRTTVLYVGDGVRKELGKVSCDSVA